MFDYDYVIVGAGLAGGVLARELAEKKGKKILIVERRQHIAGNMYDFDDKHGIKVQKYGPHVFHTDSKDVYDFICRFCDPVPYRTKCETVIKGECTPSPFNFKTCDQFYPKEEADALKEKLSVVYRGRDSVPVMEMMDSEYDDIRDFARFLFENDYRPYTAKQWGLSPEEIDPSVLKRVPVVLSYGDTYFYDKYEFMPKGGFATFYENLIDYPLIDVKLNVDAMDHIILDLQSGKALYDGKSVNIIYTGAIDELFNYKFGILPYRSLYFDFQSVNGPDFQDVPIVAYPMAKGYTRITEYTKMPPQDGGGWTSIAYEYPVKYDKDMPVGSEPYYPVLTEQSISDYGKYLNESKNYSNLILCGRLADFKYYNMDQVILRALEIYETL